MVTENAHKNGIWVGICGELGADLTLTETFLAIGVDELSVSPRSVLQMCIRDRGFIIGKPFRRGGKINAGAAILDAFFRFADVPIGLQAVHRQDVYKRQMHISTYSPCWKKLNSVSSARSAM